MREHRSISWAGRAIVSSVAAAAALTSATVTRADDAPSKDQCLDAYERAQASQKDNKLLAARKDYGTCSNPKCPKLVTSDCKKALDAIAKDVASVKVTVREAGGAELSGVEISVDGSPLPEAGADGSVELDPGDHVVRVRTSDGREAEQKLSLSAGQRGVDVAVEVPAPETKSPAPPPVEPKDDKPRIKPVVYVLGGVAALGAIGFVGFGLSGKGKQSDLDECKPDCQKDDVDSMRKSYLFADLSLGLAVVAGGAAAYLYLSGKKQAPQADVTWISPRPAPGGGELRFGTTF